MTTKYAHIQQIYDEFWRTTAEQLWRHGDDILGIKFRDLGISADSACENFIGIATAAQITELAAGLGVPFPKRMKNKRPFMVLPYEELPGRISGFMLAQYQEEFDFKRTFLAAKYQARGSGDAGYFMLSKAVNSTHQTAKNVQIIVDDPLWALKAQLTQVRYNQPLLPLCASYSDGDISSTAHSFTDVSRTKRFFYSRNITPEVISQAANGRGYVCTLQKPALPRIVTPDKTLRALKQICQSASTWHGTLSQVIKGVSDIALQSFIARLSMVPDKLRDFLARTTGLPTETVDSLTQRVNSIHFIAVEHHGAISSGNYVRDGIWCTARGLTVCNCNPVIEQVIHTEDQKYYAGYVEKDGKRYPFTDESERIEFPGLLSYAAQLLAPHGELVLYTPSWNKRAHIATMSFHPPELVVTRRGLGWDDQTHAFYCGKYAINGEGDVKLLKQYPIIRPEDALSWPEPDTIAPAELYDLLAPTSENAAVWAIIAVALSQMLAPAFGYPPQSASIDSELFAEAGAILAPLGVTTATYGGYGGATSTQIYNTMRSVQSWPELIGVPGHAKVLMRSIVHFPNKPALLRLNSASVTGALSFGWNAITSHGGPVTSRNYACIPGVIASYVRHVLQLRGPRFRADSVRDVLRNLHEWLMQTYGNSFNLDCAERLTWTAGQEHVSLITAVSEAILSRQLNLLPAARKRGQDTGYIIRNKDGWWLNQLAINRYFIRIGGLVPNWIGIMNILDRAGLLVGEQTVMRLPGLIVDRDWCDGIWKNYQEKAGGDSLSKRGVG